MHPVTVSTGQWFEYQLWLNQNLLFPIVDYVAYPDGFSTATIYFQRREIRDQFVNEFDLSNQDED